MAKGKKPAESPKEAKQIILNVDTFRRARDSVVTHLGTLQDSIQTLSAGIQTLSNNYIRHTNVILLDNATETEINSSLSKLTDIAALLGEHQRAPSPAHSAAAAEPAADGKKERKKRQHDPNAPKRPLTPFFLYMQTARPIIAQDLGPDVEKKTVATEGTRRWSTMDAGDKQLWSNAYKDNLRLYNARVHAYRNGDAQAKDMTDEDALFYAERHNIGTDNSADAQLVGEASATAPLDEDAEGEPEKLPTPPPKTPKAKARKSKGAKDTPVAAAETIVPPSSTIVPPRSAPEKEKSPDKKRKRGGKKDAVAEEEKDETSTPKSAPKSRKKKAKTDS